MTVWAFLSDVHGRGDRLARVLGDSRASGADHVLALGDIAAISALDMLQKVDAVCVFGNWEASGLRGLPVPYRSWVGRWRANHRADGFWAAHASPTWPNGLEIGGVVDYLRAHGTHWSTLFPSLQRSEAARRLAFAELEEAGIPAFFHGHTHIQEAWCSEPGSMPVRFADGQVSLILDEGAHWLVGVGSVGDPHDGPGACYALYDTVARHLTWRRV